MLKSNKDYQPVCRACLRPVEKKISSIQTKTVKVIHVQDYKGRITYLILRKIN